MPHKNREPIRAIQGRLRSHGLKARKSLGQNFLVVDSVRDAIIEAAALSPDDTVLEVGPGLGVLTEKLAASAGCVIAVELDDNLAQKLRKKLGVYPNVSIVHEDILKQDLNALVGVSCYKVVANIPYYITSPILRYFTRADNRPVMMIIMMQEEVAREVTAPEGRMGFLAVSMRLFSNPEIVFKVPADSFYPVPRVDSAVVRFNMLPAPALDITDIDGFLDLVHCGFASPRKQLRNSLSIGLKIEAAQADTILRRAGIDPGRRPGALSPAGMVGTLCNSREWTVLTVRAFAKVNLVLEVLGRRADGYHEIASIMQTVSLSDVLTLEPADRIGLKFSPPGLSDHANIALKSAQRLAEIAGFDGGVVIGLEKHVPMGAGLGGGSSDAAAVLCGLNSLWQLGLTGEQLAEIGAGLGSDVPFFVYGGTCLVEGRGDRITPLADLEKMWFVLLRPDVPVRPSKTAALYRLLKPEHYTSGGISAGARKLLESGDKRQDGPLYNVFEKVAPDAFPGLGKYMELLSRAGAPGVHLAGSGPVLFTMLYDEKQASDIFANLLADGLEAYLVTSVGREGIGR